MLVLTRLKTLSNRWYCVFWSIGWDGGNVLMMWWNRRRVLVATARTPLVIKHPVKQHAIHRGRPYQSLPAPVVQVLLLWDRLLGYDSLELLPVLAAAVIVFRADLVMQVSTNAGLGTAPSKRGAYKFCYRLVCVALDAWVILHHT